MCLCVDGTLQFSNWWLLGAVWRKQSAGKHTGGNHCQDSFSIRLLFELQAYELLTNSDSAWRRTAVPLAFLPLLNPWDLVESTKSTLESKEGKYPAVYLSQMCAISGALWFRLNSKWKQCCFFSFTPPPSSRTACQTTFLWIISDMRGPFQPSLAPLCLHSLAFIRATYWLHMAKVDCVCYPHAKGAEEIAESSVIRQVLRRFPWLALHAWPGVSPVARGIMRLRVSRALSLAGPYASLKTDIYSGPDTEPWGISDAVLWEISFATLRLVCFLS